MEPEMATKNPQEAPSVELLEAAIHPGESQPISVSEDEELYDPETGHSGTLEEETEAQQNAQKAQDHEPEKPISSETSTLEPHKEDETTVFEEPALENAPSEEANKTPLPEGTTGPSLPVSIEEPTYEPELRFEPPAPSSGASNPLVDEDEDDAYSPGVSDSENAPQPAPTTNLSSSALPRGKSPDSLPPKPPVRAAPPSRRPDNQQLLKEAYETIMQSDLVKDPKFVTLPQEEQMRLILEQLQKNNVSLPNQNVNTSANYNQVYSFNKPFKNLRNPIPLVPVNEFCRRPNITLPMTPDEQKAYNDFLQTESHYEELQTWDEFPDKLRLFVGNLPANTVTKEDLFRIFCQYGEVVQIAIKAGYGFVQFRTADACAECIKGESNVPLHNKVMRLDASSKPQRSRKRDDTLAGLPSRGRERSSDDASRSSGDIDKRSKPSDVHIYTTTLSQVNFVRHVKKALQTKDISFSAEDISEKDLSDVISEAAYSGALGICIVKDATVDVQTFETSPEGGVKFDEYADVDPEMAADIIEEAHTKKYGHKPKPQQRSDPYFGKADRQSESGYGNSRRGPRGEHGRRDDYGRGEDNGRRGQYGRRDDHGRRDDYRGYDNARNGIPRRPNDRNDGWSRRETESYSDQRHQSRFNSYDNSQNQSFGGDNTGAAPGSYHSSQPQQMRGPSSHQFQHPPPQQFQNARPPQFHNGPSPQLQGSPPVDAALLQTLLAMDPASMQNMISLLQQQQQRQGNQSQGNHIQGGYNSGSPLGVASQNGFPPANNYPPAGYQSNFAQGGYQQPQQQYHEPPQQQQQPQNDTQSLMETLARLSRK